MDREEMGKRALGLAYRFRVAATNGRDAAHGFEVEHGCSPNGQNPADITGDYVSDLVAELRGHVAAMSAVVRELDKVRAELDAASMAGVAVAVAERDGK
jgi:hypothetical protein